MLIIYTHTYRTDKAVLSAAGCMTDVITLNKVLEARLTQ